MYGQSDAYGSHPDPLDEDSYGVLLEGLRAGIKEKQIAYILGKLRDLYDDGKLDKAQKKAKRLADIVVKYQALKPEYVPDTEMQAWIAFGNGEVADPNDYYDAVVVETSSGGGLFDDVSVDATLVIAPTRRFMPRRRAADQRRQVYRRGGRQQARAGARAGARAHGGGQQQARAGARAGARMGGIFINEEAGLADDSYGGLFNRSLETELKRAQRRYEKAIKQGDEEKYTRYMNEWLDLQADWEVAQTMPELHMQRRSSVPSILV